MINTTNTGDGTTQSLYINERESVTNVSVSSQNTNLSNEEYTLGAFVTGTGNFDGAISEMISYSSQNSVLDQRKISSYLALKYGITLDQNSATSYLASDCVALACGTGTLIWDASTAAGYIFDIAGIGRDTGSNLLQLKSRSSNPDGLLAIEGDALNISDTEFLTWANNDTTTSISNTTDVPLGVY